MTSPGPRTIGRYAIHGEIASGGMATVYFGRVVGPVGFSRPVAIKQLHAQYARDPEFVEMFLDEARIAARIQHPNVVATLDVVHESYGGRDELLLVMEYLSGESLARLLRQVRTRREVVSPRIAASIAVGVLHGLHAAHEARDARGELLQVVHRDVSPQNVLVGVDGVARVLDFGVAKAVGRAHSTAAGHIKGKIAYMAPEQLRGQVSPRTDVFAASIVLWELLTTRRLFQGEHEGEIIENVAKLEIPPPSSVVETVPAELDEIVLRGLERDPALRWQTAKEMALAIEQRVPLATPSEVSSWVIELAGEVIRARTERITELESNPLHFVAPIADTVPVIAPRAPEIETSPLHAVVPATTAATEPARRRGALWLGAAAILLAVSIGSFAAVRRSESASAASSAAQVVSQTAPPSPTKAPAIDPTPPPNSAPSPAAVTSPSPVAPKVTAKPPPKVINCDPPYVRKPDGKLVPKPECL